MDGAGAGGGDHVSGGGGYTGGNQERDGLSNPSLANIIPKNGNPGNPTTIPNTRAPGGGYFDKAGDAVYPYIGNVTVESKSYGGALGGGGGINNFNDWKYTVAGDGGIAGKGGDVRVSKNAIINAFNGNKCTLSKSDTEYFYEPVNIYAQEGKLLKIVKSLATWYWVSDMNEKWSEILGITVDLSADTNQYISLGTLREEGSCSILKNDKGEAIGQGIGSGAGYIEISNGTYTVDASLN